MSKIKIYFSEYDIQEMLSQISEGDTELYDTWAPTDENGNIIDVEIYTGEEEN